MKGTITTIRGQKGSGAIQSATGECFDFELTGVLAYDVAALAAGQMVHFDLASGPSPKAVNVSIDPACGVPTGKDRDRETMRLRYIGFEHRGNMRSFCFERLVPGQQPQAFAVEADLLLFQQYQVHIQEGPALCLQMLSVGLQAEGDPQSFVKCALTGQDLASFLARQPVRGTRHGARNTRSLAHSRA
jgi:cold shock CspA family protein